MFEKFTRGEKESAKPGIGLGLAICRAIVEAHGGTIGANNRMSADGRVEGARFWFTLPVETPPASAGCAGRRRRRRFAGPRFELLKLLSKPPMSDPSITVVLIEDEKQIRRFVRTVAGRRGHRRARRRDRQARTRRSRDAQARSRHRRSRLARYRRSRRDPRTAWLERIAGDRAVGAYPGRPRKSPRSMPAPTIT